MRLGKHNIVHTRTVHTTRVVLRDRMTYIVARMKRVCESIRCVAAATAAAAADVKMTASFEPNFSGSLAASRLSYVTLPDDKCLYMRHG